MRDGTIWLGSDFTPSWRGRWRCPPLLPIKPGCFLDEVGDRLLGHGQPCRTEVVAKEVEAAFDPADECLVLVLLQKGSLILRRPRRGRLEG